MQILKKVTGYQSRWIAESDTIVTVRIFHTIWVFDQLQLPLSLGLSV